ncbi:MAG TPA: VVA0879 family protein [Pseudomonadales bacterium]
MSNAVRMSLTSFQALLKRQKVADVDFAFVCPRCRTVQSAYDFIAAGAGADFKAVEKYVGFSCIGRFTGAPAPRPEPDGKPCNWTLGGLFGAHELAVIMSNGALQPHFMPATPEQAQQHAARATQGANDAD